ncbi:TPA: hypothetical protein ACGXND_005271 [Bacillus tropicus]
MPKLTTEFIEKMIRNSGRIYFLGSNGNLVTRIYSPENVKINEYTHFFQIEFPNSENLLTINKDVSRFVYGSSLHPDDTKYGIVKDSTIGCIFMDNGEEILFDKDCF